MRFIALATPLVWLLLTAGCATSHRWTRYELCFGFTADAGHTKITEQQWQQFRDQEILPRFPDGFTLYPAQGCWRGEAGSYSEPAMTLMLVAPCNAETARKVDEIARAYKQRFHQDSVLQIRSSVSVDFTEH